VKVFSKNLELVTQFFYAAVLAFQDPVFFWNIQEISISQGSGCGWGS
jgi:hypothetical protein